MNRSGLADLSPRARSGPACTLKQSEETGRGTRTRCSWRERRTQGLRLLYGNSYQVLHQAEEQPTSLLRDGRCVQGSQRGGGWHTIRRWQGDLGGQKLLLSSGHSLPLCCSRRRLPRRRREMHFLSVSTASSASAFRKEKKKCVCSHRRFEGKPNWF